MSNHMNGSNGASHASNHDFVVKAGLARMLKGGVIMGIIS